MRANELENRDVELGNRINLLEQLNEIIDNLIGEVRVLGNRSSQLENRASRIENINEELGGRTEELENKSREFENRNAELESRSTQLENRNEELRNSVGLLTSALERSERLINTTRRNFNALIYATQRRLVCSQLENEAIEARELQSLGLSCRIERRNNRERCICRRV